MSMPAPEKPTFTSGAVEAFFCIWSKVINLYRSVRHTCWEDIMTRRILSRLILVVSLSVAFPVGIGAQAPAPIPSSTTEFSTQIQTPPPLSLPTGSLGQPSTQQNAIKIPGAQKAREMASSASANTAITTGQPGISFRYEHTFGTTAQAYLVDTQHLNGPRGLYIDASNNVYIAENRGSRILKYDASGNNTLSLGTAGLCYTDNSIFCQPQDVTIDSHGNIWVADGNRVVEYSSSGTFSQTLPASYSWESGNDSTHFSDVEGIATDATHLFVADWNNHRVQIYDISTETPTYSTTIGVTGIPASDNSHLNQPAGLALDSTGRVYIVDNGNNRVQRCTFTSAWACATLDSSLNQPYGVSVDTAGNVFIADSGNGRVRKCTSAGTCSTLISNIDGWPQDVTTDSAGNIYVAMQAGAVVRKYTAAGIASGIFKGVSYTPYLTTASLLNQPRGVAVAQDGSLYIVEANGNRLIKLAPDGTQQWAVGTPGVWGDDSTHLNSWGGGIAIDKAGRIVVADTGNNRLKLFTADGSIYSIFGQYGQGQYQFNCPAGIAANPTNGDIAVVDRCNQRIQVYTKDYLYKATLGITSESGADNTHFNNPWMIAIDSSGRIYIADSDNHRVQRCTVSGSSGTCSTFVGVTGVQGSDFGHFSHPFAVAIDANGRVYVSDEWNNRVLVFDADGAFLNNIAGSWGPLNGQLRNPEGIAVDSAGNVFIADQTNHRVQKYALGVPGWQQVNSSGFGIPANTGVPALASFNGNLYAGTINRSSGAQLLRTASGITWTLVMSDGFGSTNNVGIDRLTTFNGNLYAGTWANATSGGEIWRSNDGLNWTRVVSQGFGDPTNGEVFQLAVFSNTLYASTWSYTSTHGAEIWRSTDGLNWTRTISNGFGTPDTEDIPALTAFNGHLYAGTYNYHWTSEPSAYVGGAVWRTADGDTWEKVSTDGFGMPHNYEVSALAVFNGSLYAALANDASMASIYRCQICDGTDWLKVNESGFSSWAEALFADGPWLYWAIPEPDRGETVFRSANGTNWERIAEMGFGTYNDSYSIWSNSLTSFNNHLYIGSGSAYGGQIWKRTVTADFASSVISIQPGKLITFTNTSAGDYITSTWHFGDGSTLTQSQSLPLLSSPITSTVNHVYATSGMYTVTLTVDDGTDTNTMTQTSYIQVGYHAFLPVVMRNYNPSIALYDDFSDTSFNGYYNPLKWQTYWSSYFTATQQNGTLVFTNTLNTPANMGYYMNMIQPPQRTLNQIQTFEVRMKMSSDHAGGWTSVYPFVASTNIGGHGWWTQCSLGAGYGATQPSLGCDVHIYNDDVYTSEHAVGGTVIAGIPINFNTWYTITIAANPNTAQFKYYLNGSLFDTYTPNDAVRLITASNLDTRVGLWTGDANARATFYVDDVKITPANR